MIKKALIAWITSGIFINLWALLTCAWIFRWVYFIEPVYIYRASLREFTFSFAILSVANNFVFTGIFVLVYALIYNVISRERGGEAWGIKRGLLFGFLLWLTGWLVPVIRFALTINTSAALITYWLIDGLVIYLLIGAITGAVYKR